MAEHPILFSGPMIRAILAGDKTQTRRVVRDIPATMTFASAIPESNYKWRFTYFNSHVDRRCPYGRPPVPLETADRLWVRETWQWFGRERNGNVPAGGFQYRADLAQRLFTDFDDPAARWQDFFAAFEAKKVNIWRPSIFMPRWAARITLEITNIRVERLQELTESDAAAEGIVEIERSLYRHGRMNGYGTIGTKSEDAQSTRVNAFAVGWNALNAKRGFSWDQNPFVWVIEFRRLDKVTST